MKNNVELDNRYVVPHNPQLLRRYNCHINVEVVTTIKAIKYMYKYVYKGHDVCMIELKPRAGQTDEQAQEELRRNEPKHFTHCRYVCKTHFCVVYVHGDKVLHMLCLCCAICQCWLWLLFSLATFFPCSCVEFLNFLLSLHHMPCPCCKQSFIPQMFCVFSFADSSALQKLHTDSLGLTWMA